MELAGKIAGVLGSYELPFLTEEGIKSQFGQRAYEPWDAKRSRSFNMGCGSVDEVVTAFNNALTLSAFSGYPAITRFDVYLSGHEFEHGVEAMGSSDLVKALEAGLNKPLLDESRDLKIVNYAVSVHYVAPGDRRPENEFLMNVDARACFAGTIKFRGLSFRVGQEAEQDKARYEGLLRSLIARNGQKDVINS